MISSISWIMLSRSSVKFKSQQGASLLKVITPVT